MTRAFTRTDTRGEPWASWVSLTEREIIGMLLDSIMADVDLVPQVLYDEGDFATIPTRDRAILIPEIGATNPTWIEVRQAMVKVRTAPQTPEERETILPLREFLADNSEEIGEWDASFPSGPSTVGLLTSGETIWRGNAATEWCVTICEWRRIGSFFLVLGNEEDVISDFTWSPRIEGAEPLMEAICAPVTAYTDGVA